MARPEKAKQVLARSAKIEALEQKKKKAREAVTGA